MTVIETANAEQRAASDPRVSAFVAASAGSGKTKLLTDRLLRLMLAGTALGRARIAGFVDGNPINHGRLLHGQRIIAEKLLPLGRGGEQLGIVERHRE